MENYSLHEVINSDDKKEFSKVSVLINGNDPKWVQPLDNDIENVFDPTKNKLFEQGEAIRWTLRRGEETIGRIAAFYNRETAAKEEQPTGGCGFFDCIDSTEAATVLFDAAREWLTSRGMQAMDGSINFGDRMSWWGVLVRGFEMPLYGMNYNQPYYASLFEAYGFQNYFNQHTYLRPLCGEVRLNPLLADKAERLFTNPEYDFRICDMKNLMKMAEDFRTVYNSGWAKFEGVSPMTPKHAIEMMRTMKPIIDPNLMIFAYYMDEPVGFFIMIPDINQIIGSFKGKFGLIEKLKLVYHLRISKKINRITGVVFGVASHQQGKGVEAGLIRSFEKYADQKIAQRGVQYKTLEMMWVGDFNPVMMRMCESYVNASKYKQHVTFRYLFDRDKPFKRCPRMGGKSKN